MSEFQIRGFCLHLCTLRRFYLISSIGFKENLLRFLSSLITNPAAAGRMDRKAEKLQTRTTDDTDITDCGSARAKRAGFGVLAETHSVLHREGGGGGRAWPSFFDKMNRIL